jgi:hypothetical protein
MSVGKVNLRLVAPTTDNSKVARGRGLAGVVTIIPDENGRDDGIVVMWCGVTRLCTAYPDASLGPRARPT